MYLVMKFRNFSESITRNSNVDFALFTRLQFSVIQLSSMKASTANRIEKGDSSVSSYNHGRGHSIFWREQRWHSSMDQCTITYCNILQHSSYLFGIYILCILPLKCTLTKDILIMIIKVLNLLEIFKYLILSKQNFIISRQSL